MAHLHSVYDTDSHFSINIVTRTLKNEASSKVTVMQYDHNSERFTFEIPRYIEEHDMSLCNRVEVHYQNGANSGVYEVDDLQVSPESEDVVILSWLISQNATQNAAALDFRLTFKCVADDGKLEYVWNTAMHKGISVSSGIYNSEVIIEQYADVLEQWREELFGVGGNSGGSVAKISTVELLAANWTGSENLYSQMVTIDGVTENSQVDLTPSVEQLVIFYEKDLTFVTENDGGIVTVYAIGQKPENDYNIQVTITEVSV